MKIGIISKEAHAKSHARALEGMGHTVKLLGGSPTSVPPSLDVIICRTVSCSHSASALATQARREGKEVIFEESVSRITSAVRKMEEGGEDTTATMPVKGAFYRAYYDAKRENWRIKTTGPDGKRWKTSVTSASTREEATRLVCELDESRMKVPPDEPKAPDLPPEPDEVKTKAQLLQDLEELASMLAEAMAKLELDSYEYDVIKVSRLKMHLFTPGGVACAAASGPLTKTLDKVTCKTCQSSQIYKTAQWVLENLEG